MRNLNSSILSFSSCICSSHLSSNFLQLFKFQITSRRLMRGPPEEIVARIDEEVQLFKQRLQSAEARAAFDAFVSRKR